VVQDASKAPLAGAFSFQMNARSDKVAREKFCQQLEMTIFAIAA
jgi:hypothetical protein